MSHHQIARAAEIPTPFYEDEWVTLYHGDCRDFLPLSADAVVTDPPYGIGFEYRSYNDSRDGWFDLMDAVVPTLIRSAPFVVMPCSGIDRLGWWYERHDPDWLVAWYKGSPGHRSAVGFNDWEPHVVWGKPPKQMHDYFQTASGFDPDVDHPCPKPDAWAMWLVERACAINGTVLDPFAGSGTVLAAAKTLGRRAIGIELDADYCRVAAGRCAQDVLPVIAPAPAEQLRIA